MEFEYRYSEEQEQFRREVSSWLDANLPQGVAQAGQHPTLEGDSWEQFKNFRRRLGEQGWLALDTDLALVFLEELGRRRLGWLLDDSSSAIQTALQQYGAEAQKRTYLPLFASGEASIWRLFSEPQAKLDIGSLGVQAFREGDYIVLNGQDVFCGPGLWPDCLWGVAIINREAPPEEATAAFLVPSGLEGITIRTPHALVPQQTHQVVFDYVRVFPDALLGEEGRGWSLMQAALQGPQTIHYPVEDADVADLLQYARETVQDGASLGKQPVLQQLLVEAFINSRITRLFKLRNAWMAATGQPLTYHLAETARWEKQVSLRLSRIVRDVMGMYALLDPQDPRAPLHGNLEFQQRMSLALQNSTGVPEVYAVAIAEHLGLGKRKEAGQPPTSPAASASLSGSIDV